MSCCGKPNIHVKNEEGWWQNVRAGAVVTSFPSESAAREFLNKGIDNVPENLQPIFAALEFRMEQANS